MDKEKKRGKRNRPGNSLFISGLNRFSAWVYSCILAGLFGFIFTSYQKLSDGFRTSFQIGRAHV